MQQSDLDDPDHDDDEWIRLATELYGTAPSENSSSSETKFISLDDEFDDFDVTPKRAAEISKTLSLLRRVRGELYLLEGQWFLARQLHTEQLRNISLEPVPAGSEPVMNATSNYLDMVFANKNGAQRDMVSNEVVELTRKMMREYNGPTTHAFLNELGKNDDILSIKFQNIEETLYYTSAFAYKYLTLYLPTSPQLVLSCQLLERFWIAIRQLPIGDSNAPFDAVLSPYIALLCLKLFKWTDGGCNLQLLFTIVPGIGTRRPAIPWLDITKRTAAFLRERIDEGPGSEDEAQLDPDYDDDDADPAMLLADEEEEEAELVVNTEGDGEAAAVFEDPYP